MRFDTIPPIEEAIVEALRSPAFAAAGDEEERKRALMVSLSETLHSLGQRLFPAPPTIGRYFAIVDRNARLWSEFDGRNYDALADRYGLSTRHVREIVERMRQKKGGGRK